VCRVQARARALTGGGGRPFLGSKGADFHNVRVVLHSALDMRGKNRHDVSDILCVIDARGMLGEDRRGSVSELMHETRESQRKR